MSKNKISKKRIALTGTPMHNSPLDIYAQFRFLDFNIFNKNFTQFKSRYAIEKTIAFNKEVEDGAGGFESKACQFKKVVGFQNEEELNAIFYSRASRVKTRDVIELPPVMHETRTCELSPSLRKIYNELEKEFVSWVQEEGEKISVSNALVKILRLSQLTGGYLQIDDGEGRYVDDSKLSLLEDIFIDLDPDEPIVIFSRFTNEIQRIKALAKKCERTVAELSGHMNQLTEWQDGKFNVLVAQERTGKEGIDLTRSRYTVYFSKGPSLGDHEQTLARVDRPGQTREGFYYHLMATDTVDIDIHQSLMNKKNVVEYILQKRR